MQDNERFVNFLQMSFKKLTYKDSFVFNEQGRVIAVASLEPIVKAHKSIKDKILDFLLNQKDNKGE